MARALKHFRITCENDPTKTTDIQAASLEKAYRYAAEKTQAWKSSVTLQQQFYTPLTSVPYVPGQQVPADA